MATTMTKQIHQQQKSDKSRTTVRFSQQILTSTTNVQRISSQVENIF